MSRITNILSKIRLGFADVRYIFNKVPEMVKGIKNAPEKKILKQRLHQMTDVIVETYGDLAISIAKNFDTQLFQNIVEDVCLMVAKYQEPLKNQVKILAKELTTVVENHNEKTNKVGTEFQKVLERIGRREGWNKWDLPSDKARHKESEAAIKRHNQEQEANQATAKARKERIIRELKSIYTEESFRLRHGLSEGPVCTHAYDLYINGRADYLYDEAHQD